MQQQDKKTEAVAFSGASTKLVSAPFVPHDDDSIERITTLGVKLTNPYLIPNMQKAYTNLGYSSSLATVTNLYVRFKPTVGQLAALDSIMDAQGLEIFDTPVDYDVTYEGDYYQDPSIPDSLPTWQYAVVPVNFIFPSGITNETLAQIHIPGDNYTAMETEAERLASIQDSLNGNTMYGNVLIGPNSAQNCPPCYVWDPISRQCVPQEGQCGTGYPPPAADASVPGGNIFVFDTNLPGIGNGSEFSVRKVRVVARRWFKEERTFTDVNGHFVFTKHFKNKVRIIEKFKNADAYIYGVRGIKLWQMLFPVKRELGIYSSDKATIVFHNDQAGPVNSKGNRYWAAATTHNAVQEHRDYATQFGFSAAPTTMNIYLTNWGISQGLASTPLFHKRYLTDLPSSFINTYLVYAGTIIVAGGISALAAVIARVNVDMAIDYHTDLAHFTSDWLKATVYHEMSHASQYSQVGTNWYTQFVNAELNQIYNYPSGQYNPYGQGASPSYSPIIALGEAWGYHMEHFLTDQRYGVNASDVGEYWGTFFHSRTLPLTAHPYIDAIENNNPNSSADPFAWIPEGLMEDLIDNTPAEAIVNDQVTGYSISQLFGALQSDVTSIPQYKAKLLQLYGTAQQTQVNNLFASYHY